MNYQTVRLVSSFGSGSCISSFGSSPKVETAAVSSFELTQFWAYPKVETVDAFKVLGRFHFWACTNTHIDFCSLRDSMLAMRRVIVSKFTTPEYHLVRRELPVRVPIIKAIIYTSFKRTVHPGKSKSKRLTLAISYFVLLSQPLFIPCLFEKVF